MTSTYTSPHALRVVTAALLLTLGSGCGELRSRGDDQASAIYNYQTDVAPLLKTACGSCHAGTAAKGSYDLSSWRGLLGPGSDLTVRNAIPGDKTSALLTALDKGTQHKGLLTASQLTLLTNWVVKDKLAYSDGLYHPSAWLYPGDRTSQAFHGGVLRAAQWDTQKCQACHGSDLLGGKSGKSCQTCHTGGPTGCGTCHGDDVSAGPPPSLSWGIDPTKDRGVGAHAAHTSPTSFAALACTSCHKVPTKVDDAGHLPSGQELKDGKLAAEVTFDAKAAMGGVTPAYDAATGTCTVYCHGVKSDKTRTPTWTAGITKKCDTCHAAPHKDKGGADCSACHQQTVKSCTPGTAGCLTVTTNVGVSFLSTDLHLDGKSPTGAKGAEGTCYGCHGTKASAGAPSPDLAGNTDISRVSVGLHALHLAKGTYRDALPCTTCHTVPTSEKDKGHYDNDLPAEVTFDKLASGTMDGGTSTSPAWDHKAGACSNVYCHGLDGGKVGTAWKWTSKLTGGLACDSCHGNPPAKTRGGSAHTSASGCHYCHSSAYDSNGTALLPAKHINGKVDL